MGPIETDPLILTASFDPLAAARWQRLRDQHFPPGRNIVPAHLTLFHHLPGLEREGVEVAVEEACRAERPMRFVADGLRFLGRGVAFAIEAPRLEDLRARLADRWSLWLTPQDRQPFRPHVTVQNKAEPEAARALHKHLTNAFEPVEGMITGLDLWHYRGGPWALARHHDFGSP